LASNGKKKTTFAKLNREAAVRERRQIKNAKREARKTEEPGEDTTIGEPIVIEPVSDEELAAALARP
jgi:hypothetical protein